MKKTLLVLSLLAVSSASAQQYSGIDDPKLLKEAKIQLQQRYPSLTPHDIENLAGIEADRILNGAKTPENHTG